MVEFVHHAFQLDFRDVLKAGILWKILPQQPVGILIGASFPCRIGMSEVEGQI
jgi:hypothetical protein